LTYDVSHLLRARLARDDKNRPLPPASAPLPSAVGIGRRVLWRCGGRI